VTSADPVRTARDPALPPGTAGKGVAARILGVSLMVLGMLNGMLAWRGALPENDFALILWLAGALLFVIGVLRGAPLSQR